MHETNRVLIERVRQLEAQLSHAYAQQASLIASLPPSGISYVRKGDDAFISIYPSGDVSYDFSQKNTG